jgi:hypothetical protein
MPGPAICRIFKDEAPVIGGPCKAGPIEAGVEQMRSIMHWHR